MNEAPIIRFYDSYFELDGLKISYEVLGSIANPPKDKRLYSLKREGETMTVRMFQSAEAASKFFEEQEGS